MGFLRTLLALAVVFAHSPWNSGYVLVGGPNAVRLFYIISGFLIAHVLKTNSAYNDAWRFYANRALKIYPMYLLVAGLSGLWLYTHEPAFAQVYASIPASATALLVASNLLIFGQDWVMFSGISGSGSTAELVLTPNFMSSPVLLYKGLLVPQAWTLGVELSFYALAPWLLRRHATLLVVLAAALAVRVGLFALGWGPKDPWTYRFFPAELALFLTGALANHWLLPAWVRLMKARNWQRLPMLATAVMLFICTFYFRVQAPEGWKIAVLLPVFVALLPLTFLFQNASAWDKAVGELSYPIYVGHMLMIWMGTWALAQAKVQLPPLAQAVLFIALSCAFAYALKTTVADLIEKTRTRVRGAQLADRNA